MRRHLTMTVLLTICASVMGTMCTCEDRSTRRRETGSAANRCQSHLKQIALAMHAYLDDYSGVFPPADRWTDAMTPYLMDRVPLACPSDSGGSNGYAFSRALGGKRLSDVRSPTEVPMVYESTAGRPNAADDGSSWPTKLRHRSGNHCAFVDGNVQALKRKPGFAVR